MLKFNKTDIFIAVFVLLLAAICFVVCLFLFKAEQSAAEVEIYKDNKLYGTYALNESQLIEIHEGGVHICTVKIENEGVCMHYSCCKNQICVNSGILTREKAASSDLASWIVCLPNAVTIHLNVGDAK